MTGTSTDKPITFVKEEITGIKIQYLKVIFTNVKDNDKFIVTTDVGKIEFNEKRISDEGDMQIEIAIPKNSSQIIIKYEREEKISEKLSLTAISLSAANFFPAVSLFAFTNLPIMQENAEYPLITS